LLNNPKYEQHKISKDEKWPWQKDPKTWYKTLFTMLAVILFNVLVVLPIFIWVWFTFINRNVVKHAFEIRELPNKFNLIW
jgi:ABC-type tungstate transport system substrate-binding protein